MKKLFKIVFFSFLINSLTSYSQEIEKDSIKNTELLYVAVEVNPAYSGGNKNLYSFIKTNLNLGNQNEYLGKRIMIYFIVEKDGTLSDIKIGRGIDENIDNQMIEIFKKMPKWKPGIQNGRPVRTQYQLPYTIT